MAETDDELVEVGVLAGMYARAEHDGIPAERVRDAIHAYGIDKGDWVFARAVLAAVRPKIEARERERCAEVAAGVRGVRYKSAIDGTHKWRLNTQHEIAAAIRSKQETERIEPEQEQPE